MFRILFAGTPAIAVPSLQALAASGRLVGVLTAPDARSGRGNTEVQCEVKQAALGLGLPVLQPERLDATARDQVAALAPDLLVCFAYGRIFGPRFLGLFPRGGINVHPSLLPQFRGPSPINAAILAGLDRTGITVQTLAQDMDAGDVILQQEIRLDGSETAGSLGAYCADAGAGLLLAALDLLERGTACPVPQDGALASYCHLISKDDGHIDWSRPARELERIVRAYAPWPRAWTTWNGQKLYLDVTEALAPEPDTAPAPVGTVLKVDKARGFLIQTGQGLLAVRQLQLQSKKSMDHTAFFNGARSFAGSILGE